MLAFDFPPLEPALDFYARRQLLTTPTLKSTNNGICTKTMGADPRLNPALIVDDKEEIQPKKKVTFGKNIINFNGFFEKTFFFFAALFGSIPEA